MCVYVLHKTSREGISCCSPPKSTIRKSREKNFGYEARKKPKKPWVTEQMIDKMKERRKWKNVNTECSRQMHRSLNNELRRETDRARVVWWEGPCRELDELDRSGRSDLVYYAKMKEINQEDRGSKKQGNVVSKRGTLLTDSEDVKERW